MACFWIWAESIWQNLKTTFCVSNLRFWWNSYLLIETSFLNVVGLWAKSFQQICQNCINCLEERIFYLVGKFILLFSLSRFRRTLFGTFTNHNGRIVKLAVSVFSGICWGKSSLVEKVYKSASVLHSEQIETWQVCQKCIFDVHSNILKKNIFVIRNYLSQFRASSGKPWNSLSNLLPRCRGEHYKVKHNF